MSENATGESQFLSVIRVWAALAWADGVIADQEAAAMRRLIGGAELSEQERDTALSWLEQRVELDTSNIAALSEPARHGIYRAAVRLAGVDLVVADEERAFLVRLREGLGIDGPTAAELEASVPPPPSVD
jgi:uncharacterized membrane protein YebE (DUF533 family)